MKIIHVEEITACIESMCSEANTILTKDMQMAISQARVSEQSPTGCAILDTIQENLDMAEELSLPICQDTGMAVVFVRIGQDVSIKGGALSDAINMGIHNGYINGYLRKSVVADPIDRVNTEDNTPAVIHYDIVPGDQLEIKLMPKGFGSENTSALKMLKPSDGEAGVESFVLDTIEKGAPNACAPIVVGVGVGGTFEKATLLAKNALSRPLGMYNQKNLYANMEKRLLKKANNLGIGPMGLGGVNTVLGVAIEEYPTHIAGLPVAVNICCYVNRHVVRIL